LPRSFSHRSFGGRERRNNHIKFIANKGTYSQKDRKIVMLLSSLGNLHSVASPEVVVSWVQAGVFSKLAQHIVRGLSSPGKLEPRHAQPTPDLELVGIIDTDGTVAGIPSYDGVDAVDGRAVMVVLYNSRLADLSDVGSRAVLLPVLQLHSVLQ
jgi:hypothetical protein